MAHDHASQNLATEVPSPLSPVQVEAVDAIVAEAEARLLR